MPAGELRERVAFDQKAQSDTVYGIAAGDWEEQFREPARIRYLVGSEPVIAQRLQGIQPAVITVRANHLTRAVDSGWRIRDVRTGKPFNIRSITPDEINAYIDLLCETGTVSG